MECQRQWVSNRGPLQMGYFKPTGQKRGNIYRDHIHSIHNMIHCFECRVLLTRDDLPFSIWDPQRQVHLVLLKKPKQRRTMATLQPREPCQKPSELQKFGTTKIPTKVCLISKSDSWSLSDLFEPPDWKPRHGRGKAGTLRRWHERWPTSYRS